MDHQNSQFIYLVIANFSILFVGWGLFPLLPVYAGNFKTTAAHVGIYLALTYLSITLGTLMPGLLYQRISRKLLLVAAGSMGASALFLLGQATDFWQVVLLTGSVWFTGGIGLATISVLTGLHAGAGNRGKTFSLLPIIPMFSGFRSEL